MLNPNRVVWSKALQLTAICLTNAMVRISAGVCEKVASDLGLGGGVPVYRLRSRKRRMGHSVEECLSCRYRRFLYVNNRSSAPENIAIPISTEKNLQL